MSKLAKKQLHHQKGFTLLELLMVIAVIGVLASIAVPRFQNTTQKARFTEVVNAAAPYKTAVELCIANLGAQPANYAACNAGTNGIPPAATALGSVASVTVVGGVITATGANSFNAADSTGAVVPVTYELRPAPSNFGVTWAVGGTCTDAAINLCN